MKAVIAWTAAIILGALLAYRALQPPAVLIEQGPIYPTISPLMDKTYWHFKFAAKITNKSGEFLILPAFRISIPHAFQSVYETTSTSCVAPGGSYYQFFGGMCPIVDRASLGVPKVTFLHNDWYITRAYAEKQISSVARMKIQVLSWEAYDNGAAALKIQFTNESGVKVSSLDGTALFIGADGSVLDGEIFDIAPGAAGERELDVFDVPQARQATKCVIQINAFRSPSQDVPVGVPPGPSVQ